MTKEEAFTAFWKAYPNRKGKADAQKAFDKAIKQTTLETMIAAIAAYIANKPAWQDFKHPATWLRAGCWDDEWTPAVPIAAPPRQGDMSDFMRSRMDSRNANTIDAEYERGSDRSGTRQALAHPSDPWRH